MVTNLKTNTWDCDGNLIVPLRGIRIALSLAFADACAFFWFGYLGDKQWHEQHPGTGASAVADPTWMAILWIAIPAVPFLLSMFLLSTRSENSKAAGAGFAAGLIAVAFIFAVVAILSVFFRFSPDPYAWPEVIAALVFLACSVWILVAACLIGKGSWGPFSFTFAATLIALAWAGHAMDDREYVRDRQHEQQKAQAAVDLFTPVVQAQHVLASLAGCLILNQSLHPDPEYPSSLDPPPQDWPCETRFAATAVVDYRLSYVPETTANGRVTNFHLIAMPVKTVRGHFPLMVDKRGILFSDAMWGYSSPSIRAATTEATAAEIQELKRSIDDYMQRRGLADAPKALNSEMVRANFGYQSLVDGQHMEVRNYAFRYLVSRARGRTRYALAAQCLSYGQDCLRSYFVDYDGVLHATGEPRAATADDAYALECESNDSQCEGVIWPAP